MCRSDAATVPGRSNWRCALCPTAGWRCPPTPRGRNWSVVTDLGSRGWVSTAQDCGESTGPPATTATPGRGRRPSVRGSTRQESDPVSIDIGDLDTVAKLLATGAMGIDELGSDPAPIPDAGAATPLLVEALGSIASALDAEVRSLTGAADAT